MNSAFNSAGEKLMKNSLNYTGFSNTLVVSRKRKKASSNSNIAIEAEQIAADDASRYYPPYLMPENTVKSSIKK